MFFISQQDLERNETLEPADLGKPAILINGCIEVMETEARAKHLEQLLSEDNRKQGK